MKCLISHKGTEQKKNFLYIPDSERVEAEQFTLSPGPAELTAETASVYQLSGNKPVTTCSVEGD